MNYVIDLLRSFGCGIILAGLSFLLAAHRFRKSHALRVAGYVEGEQDRLRRYRDIGGRIAEKRPLSDSELRMLTYLLCEAEVVPGPFCNQVPLASVVARCGCGCPTIDIEVLGVEVDGDLRFPICEYLWRDQEGNRFGIIPVAQGSKLVGLQLYAMDDTRKPKELPPIADLHTLLT